MKFRKIQWGSWWWLGELCEVSRCLLEGNWDIIVLCTMFLVSCIFNKCLYFSHYMVRYLLDRPHILVMQVQPRHWEEKAAALWAVSTEAALYSVGENFTVMRVTTGDSSERWRGVSQLPRAPQPRQDGHECWRPGFLHDLPLVGASQEDNPPSPSSFTSGRWQLASVIQLISSF